VKKRRVPIILAGCLAAGILVALSWPHDRGPSFKGKTLLEWLVIATTEAPNSDVEGDPFDLDRFGTTKSREAGQAVRQIGNAGIPFLISWIEYEPSPVKVKLVQLIKKLPTTPKRRMALLNWFAGPENRAALAERGFGFLARRQPLQRRSWHES